VGVRQALQADGELDIAGAHDVLYLEILQKDEGVASFRLLYFYRS